MKNKLVKFLLKKELKEVEDLKESLINTFSRSIVDNMTVKSSKASNELDNIDLTFEQLLQFCIKSRTISFKNKDGYAELEHDFLDGLSEPERKNKITELGVISRNTVFKEFIGYLIDFFGTNCVIKEDVQEMKNAQIALIAVKAIETKLKSFENELNNLNQGEDEEDL